MEDIKKWSYVNQVTMLTFILVVFLLSFPNQSHACTQNVSRGSEGAHVGYLQLLISLTEDYTYGEIIST
ncbi:MAG: hypothetical protein AAFO91_18685 [Bacteroidota bacterium]